MQTILAAIPPERIMRMQREVVRVFEAFFSSLAQQVHTAVRQHAALRGHSVHNPAPGAQ